MGNDSSGEKTEEPTQKKINDARKKGQVWKSKDFTGVLSFVFGLGVVSMVWPILEGEVAGLVQFGVEKLSHPEDLEQATIEVLFLALRSLGLVTLPVVVTAACVAALVDFLQVGPLLAKDAMKPKIEKLNPVQGLKNMFSKKQMVELIKNLFKIGVTALVVYGCVKDSMDLVSGTIRGDVDLTFAVMGEMVFRVVLRATILLLVFSTFDIWWQRHSYYEDQKMTKDEVKREYKESEGDPQHKAKRREMHHEILESAQMEAVSGADVVVTNPDHVAVALRYDADRERAPTVLAKGIDLRAEGIKAIAKRHDVAILRNVPLAHSLLRVEVGEEIPEDLYDAVAEVLNFVYSLRVQAPAAVARG